MPGIYYTVNQCAKLPNNPIVIYNVALLHLIRFVKNSSNKSIKLYLGTMDSPIYKYLKENTIEVKKGTITTFSDSLWNNCIDIIWRSKGWHITFVQGKAVDYSCHCLILVAMFSGEIQYISAAEVYTGTSHLRKIVYDLQNLGSPFMMGNLIINLIWNIIWLIVSIKWLYRF